MTKYLVVFMTFLLLLPATAGTQNGYADLVEQIQDGVVNIQVTQEVSEQQAPQGDLFEFFFQQRPRGRRGAPQPHQASGTGFIISKDGYIVTNRHVVQDADSVKVLLADGSSHDAEVVGSDDSLDVAVLKIDGHDLTPLKVGDSDAMRIGDIVLAIGYPLQLGFSVTSGLISGIGRNMQAGRFDVASYIQTDADITFGNSGGPLVNTAGEVIAINTMIVQRGETYGFSIPSKLFMNSVDQLRSHGKVRRGALGVSIGNLDDATKEYYKLDQGALVSNVTRGLAAEKAGIRGGDIILAIDGVPIKGSQDVITIVANHAPGDALTLNLLSEGKKITKKVTLSDRDKLFGEAGGDDDGASTDPGEAGATGLGFSVQPLDAETRDSLNLPRGVQGLAVVSVDEGGLAFAKGLRTGAILLEIDGKKVTSLADMRAQVGPLKEGQVTSIRVLEASEDYPTETRERTLILRKQ